MHGVAEVCTQTPTGNDLTITWGQRRTSVGNVLSFTRTTRVRRVSMAFTGIPGATFVVLCIHKYPTSGAV